MKVVIVKQPSQLGSEDLPFQGQILRTVIVRPTNLINRLMFSVTRFAARSSCTNLKGSAAGAAARIFPMTRPFANRLRRFEGTPKLRRYIIAGLDFASVAYFWRYGDVEKLVF